MCPDSITKRCTKCGETKPLSAFNKYKDGHTARCSECLRLGLREYRARLRAVLPLRICPDTKVCALCRAEKPAHEFDSHIHSKGGLSSYCKECRRTYASHAYHGSARERMLRDKRATWWRYRARNLATNRAYQQSHREKINQHARAWRKRNPDAVRHFRRMRQAREKNAPGSYSRAEWQAMCDWFGPACLCCGSVEFLTVDHVMPLALGGSNSIENLQPLCLTCNKRKNDSYADYRDNDQLSALLAFIKSMPPAHSQQ